MDIAFNTVDALRLLTLDWFLRSRAGLFPAEPAQEWLQSLVEVR
jgi:hypothetical protein